MKKLTYVLPFTDDLLADWRPSPNVCVPLIGHGCFIHTVPSWRCGDLVTENPSSLGWTNARAVVLDGDAFATVAPAGTWRSE